MRSVVYGISVAVAALVAGTGPGAAQAPNQGVTGHYEQHNLGPTGCDVVVSGASKKGNERQIHFDEGQRQFIAGQMVACRGGKIVDANAPPPVPYAAPKSP